MFSAASTAGLIISGILLFVLNTLIKKKVHPIIIFAVLTAITVILTFAFAWLILTVFKVEY